jgi:6-pyruvoyltetrahydropterin/6-carboxytetrahydropterin synthase
LYSLKACGHFDSAHFLAGYSGKCKNIHGHRFTVEAEITGEPLPGGENRGMIVDFGDLKRVLRDICDRFDHTLIYEKGTLSERLLCALNDEGLALCEVDYRPTAENFAKSIYDKLTAGLECFDNCYVRCVAVYETPDNCAVYAGDSPINRFHKM